MRRIRKYALRVLLALACAGALLYAADEVSARLRGRPTEDMKVDRLYSAVNHWNQVEYSVGTPVTQTCVDALLPHFGYVPCWYLRKHTIQQVSTN